MRVDIKKITSALNKVTALTSEFKGASAVPGVLLDLSDNLLKVNFTDSHKAVTEEISVETEEGDFFGPIVVNYELFLRAISNCQPNGSIKVKDVVFTYDTESTTLVISADMLAEVRAKDGENEAEYRKISTKHMDIKWQSIDADMRTKVLTRVDYVGIFSPAETEVVDTYKRDELIKKLKIASVEKGKQVYISSKTQSIFVSNQAHATTIPVSKLNEAGDIRIHSSLVMTQSLAKSVIDILSKTSAEDVQVYSREKTCNIFIEDENEKVGIWFEMPPASKVHVTAVDRYNSLGYATYHTAFMRDFIKDIVRSASASSKDSKVEIMFVPTTDGVASPFDLVINGGSASKSTKDLYSLNAEYVAGDTEKLLTEKFVINLELLTTMLNPLETELVAVDFEAATDGSKCIRVAEIDIEELDKAYADARKETQRICEESGQEFKENETPTPLKVKMQYMRREGVLKTKQYTTLLK